MLMILMGGGDADNADDDGWSVGHWLIIKELVSGGDAVSCHPGGPSPSKPWDCGALYSYTT